MSDDAREPVGSLAEEAAKLLGALQGWAQETGSDTAAGSADLLSSINEHIATGGADCRFCPVCRMIAGVRETTPEVRDHLASAATSLLHAAAGAMASFGAEHSGHEGRGGERIDVTDDEDWEDD